MVMLMVSLEWLSFVEFNLCHRIYFTCFVTHSFANELIFSMSVPTIYEKDRKLGKWVSLPIAILVNIRNSFFLKCDTMSFS